MNGESRQKARLWLAAVFVLGAAIGIVFGYSFAQHRTLAAPLAMSAPPPEPERRAKRVAEMTRELGLSPDQTKTLDSIIHDTHDEMKAIREKSDGDVEALRQKARNEMRQMLTPEQEPKFEEMVARMDAERKKQQQEYRK
jgi:hypothetical protein